MTRTAGAGATDPAYRVARRRVLRDGVGIGVATGTYGLSFGALAVVAGLSTLQACALSLVMFTGASQFAFVGVVAAGGTPLAAAASAVLLGTRNALYGLHLSRVLRVRGAARAGAAQLMIDESAAMSFAGAAAEPTPGAFGEGAESLARLGFYTAGGAVFVGWNLATLFGALGAQALSDPGRFGLDAVAPAAFAALLAPRLKDRQSWVAALVAVLGAVLTAPVLPAGVPVLLAATIVILVVLLGPSGWRAAT